MKIETERLEVILLSMEQLKLWVEDISRLEDELECYYRAEPMEGIFFDIVKNQIVAIQNDLKNYVWNSFWFIIRKSDRVVVGSIGFKGIPNNKGEVEIGYGLGKEYEKRGYMTEAIGAMCKWVLRQKGISQVIAETEIDGIASQNILTRCGFSKYDQGETLWWRL